MLDKTIITQPTDNGKNSAAVPQLFQQPNITELWSIEATKAIAALIDFRSAAHRWLAQGRVDDAEFVRELQRLEDAGLSAWADDLIALAMLEVTR